MLKYYTKQVVFQEVPNEISVSFSIAGCPNNCKGCSWKNAIQFLKEKELTDEYYYDILQQYKNLASCILFLGGEWDSPDLVNKLRTAQEQGYKTCLYTGLDLGKVKPEIMKHLDYIKVGPYIANLGGLSERTTNQKFINVKTGEIMNHYFVKSKEGSNNE